MYNIEDAMLFRDCGFYALMKGKRFRIYVQ